MFSHLSAVKEEPRSRPAVHECLGEVLRVLRQVISTYPLLNTVETLTAAGTLISKVKGQSNCHVKLIFLNSCHWFLLLKLSPKPWSQIIPHKHQMSKATSDMSRYHTTSIWSYEGKTCIICKHALTEIQVFPLLHLSVMSLLVLFVIKAEARVCDREVVLFSVFVRVQLWRHHWRSEERLWESHWDHCCGLQQQVRPAALLPHQIPDHLLFIN